ncbi:hypothetical protein [Streptomyces xiaopingdaonensis]|uniref:hypothetical protein n=1 Tax=Streptomyces xiaopingdaonensis TaxID=1565415 RepID=UPI00036351F6|nr:hypothetical protein [Streptomyces xiaopingdaonensis]
MRHVHRPRSTRRGGTASSAVAATPRTVLQSSGVSASLTSTSVTVEENDGNG